MNRRSHFLKSCSRGLLLATAATALILAVAAESPTHIRGSIVSFAGDKLTVQTAHGNVSISLDAATRVSGIVPSSANQIKEGTFVGIANVPGATGSSALEVVVFPDAMKGSGLGDYPWDSPAQGGARSPSAMTNGTVKSSAASVSMATGSAMTNGTVRKTSSANGLVLTVDYGKGEKTIEVPSGVPVVGIAPTDRSKLVPGAHVFIAPRKDAPGMAGAVAVGIDGAVPPM
ncbi:MAG: hypothetical protein ABI330_19065 [Caldimonas sp.]